MYPIDIPAIERQARELRAAEIQRMNGLFAERTHLLTRLAANTAAAGAYAPAPTYAMPAEPETYKAIADHVREAIMALSVEERALRRAKGLRSHEVDGSA